ncbi:MAG: arsenate reductase (glutaredoxin) [Crocinitomicaceae bacterium]|jgi:arsenate reductase (glutaredoxin)|nr:arsenate reductase (glutaredoxin) [Crocinitomicaceae bacterium]MBT6030573.1 arsenate reductase (glutaredoxin) [Crocinitomicaceae bacterium]MBT6513831.1 arsenate reductase (glutaredoxin) [Crocinitomicaceae bacterium]
MKIYHNPRCTKSREGLKILQDAECEFEIVEYLKDGLTVQELSLLIKQLGFKAEELVRKTEAIYKEKFRGKIMSDEDWISAMVAYPKLIQRPILVHKNQAIVGRPPELFCKLI